MPSKNRCKDYIKGAYYHIYNRGVNKRNIFKEPQDYNTFLHYLASTAAKEYIRVEAYCLMPNHYHLLVQNAEERGIEKLMRSLATSYAMIFNKKYGRVGHLFQERYKAALIKTEEHYKTVLTYIHENPKDGPFKIEDYPYSSYKNYLKTKGPSPTPNKNRGF